MIRQTARSFAQKLLLAVGRASSALLFQIRLEGLEHVPHRTTGFLLIANHFSWFDPIILALALPFTPVFLIASEVEHRWWMRLFTRLFDCIPVWRGQVDRTALHNAARALAEGKVLAIFPEGGINPELAGRVGRGEQVTALQGNLGRIEPKLVHARPGAALLAVSNKVCILPVALLGTERIYENIRSWRRTSVTVRMGPVFGPLVIDESLRGRARRRQLDELAGKMMEQIAILLPMESRGPYI